MKHVSIIVRAEWDEEARVWVATSNDISGLAVEAGTLEEIKGKVENAISDLLELNGLEDLDGSLRNIPIHIMAEQLGRVPNPRSHAH